MKRYRAFISYNQKDKPVVKRLHRWLETYRVPRGVPADMELGPGRRLGRFFRDDEEMAASPDIGGTVRGAIEDAESLIIVCSPNAARSKWVDAEIQHFRKTGRERRIFAVMVAGTPNSGDPKTECFPPSLRVASDPDDPESMPIEPLALDLRKEGRARLLARLAAGLLGVNFDTLWNRDRRRARARRDTVLSTVLGGVLALSAAGAAIVRAQNGERSTQLVSAAQAQADAGAHESALRLSALAMQTHVLLPAAPDAEAMLARASHESLSRAAFAFEAGAVTAVAASADGRWLASAADNVFAAGDQAFMVIDRTTGRPVERFAAPQGRVEHLAFSPDGNQLALAQPDRFPEVRDAATGAVRFQLAGERYVPAQMDGHSPVPTEAVGEHADRLIYSADGAYIAANSSLGGVRIYDAATGAMLARHPALEDLEAPGPGALPFAARFAFLPGGRLIAAVTGADFAVIDPRAGRVVLQFARPRSERRFDLTLEQFAVSADGGVLAAAWRDGYLASFDLATGDLLSTYAGMAEGWGPRALWVDRELDRLTLVDQQGAVRAWTLSSGAALFTLAGAAARTTAVHMSQDGRTALSIHEDGLARLLNVRTGEVLRSHRAPLARVGYEMTAADGRGALFTGDDAGGVREWAVRSPRIVTAIPGFPAHRDHGGLRFYVNGLDLDESGDRLLAWLSAREVFVWDLAHGGAPRVLDGPAGAQITHAGLGPDGSAAVIGFGGEPGPAVREVDGEGPGATLQAPPGDWPAAMVSISVSAANDAVLVGYDSLKAVLYRRAGARWDAAHTVAESLQENQDLYLEGNIPMTAVALSRDGTRALTASDTGRIALWNALTGEMQAVFAAPSAGVAGAVFSPDGYAAAVLHRSFVSPGDRAPLATIYTREGETWAEAHVLTARESGGHSLFFSPDGARLVTIVDGAAIVWDAASGRRLSSDPLGLSLYRADAAYADDGRTLLVAINADFRDRTEPRSPVFGLQGALMRIDVSALSGPENRQARGLAPLKAAVCDPVTGWLRGDLRLISDADVAAVPSLAPRLGQDACAPPRVGEDIARLLSGLAGERVE
ncbi:MAG: TIR domain-containing protein [Oceanicaulis sp.]